MPWIYHNSVIPYDTGDCLTKNGNQEQSLCHATASIKRDCFHLTRMFFIKGKLEDLLISSKRILLTRSQDLLKELAIQKIFSNSLLVNFDV